MASAHIQSLDDYLTFTPSSMQTYIDPQKLTSTRSASPETSMDLEDADHVAEHDDDYGFAKFAAERDAIRNEQDEDSRLLMSEAGKQLSSKERRQLRNKVSARNFRERRKEYITHLEGLVSKHQNEAMKFKKQVDTLKVERDELSTELSKLKISISAAIESNKLNMNTPALARTASRSSTPTKERESLIPNLQKDVNPNPWSSNGFNMDWPLSSMGSPSKGNFEFNLHNYTSVFTARPVLPAVSFSEKELLGKESEPENCLVAFDSVLTSILGTNWKSVVDEPTRM